MNNFSAAALTPAIKLFPGVVDTGQKYLKSLKFIASVNDNGEKLTVLIPACLGLKMKTKQKFKLQV